MNQNDPEGQAFLSALIGVRRSRMTQSEIADKMGVSQSTVSQFENGADPRMSTIRRYARVLGVRIAHVIEEPHHPCGDPDCTESHGGDYR